jgi:hypothetical protein
VVDFCEYYIELPCSEEVRILMKNEQPLVLRKDSAPLELSFKEYLHNLDCEKVKVTYT